MMEINMEQEILRRQEMFFILAGMEEEAFSIKLATGGDIWEAVWSDDIDPASYLGAEVYDTYEGAVNTVHLIQMLEKDNPPDGIWYGVLNGEVLFKTILEQLEDE